MAGQDFLDIAVQIAFVLLCLSFLLTVLRVVRGPTYRTGSWRWTCWSASASASLR